jgi:hypothetical protein
VISKEEMVQRVAKRLVENPELLYELRDRLQNDPIITLPIDLYTWQTFYQEIWGIKKDFSDLKIPDYKDGFNWLIVMLGGMTSEKIVQKMREHMEVRVIDGERFKKVESIRTTDKDYAILVRDRVEADEELKHLSADDLKANGTNCITLEERLMLEFFYWWRTKKHLDITNFTLCAGSRYSDGSVPCVYWNPGYGGVCVSWCYGDDRYGTLRSRQAVS